MTMRMLAAAVTGAMLLAAPAWGDPPELAVEVDAEPAAEPVAEEPAPADAEEQSADPVVVRLDQLEAEYRSLAADVRETLLRQNEVIGQIKERLADLDAGPGMEATASDGGAHVEASGTVTIDGTTVVPVGAVVTEVSTTWEAIVVRGLVLGNVVTVSGDIYIEDGGRVNGNAVSVLGEVHLDDGGVVSGNRVSLAPAESLSAVTSIGSATLFETLYHRLVFLLAFAGAGVLVIGLFPDRVGRIARHLEARPLRAGFVGLATVALVTFGGVLFGITIVGLPVSFLLIAGLGLAWLLGFIGLCQVLGDRLPFRYKPHGRWLAFLVGSILLSCLGALPWVGWVVVMGASLVGVGAAFSTRLGSR